MKQTIFKKKHISRVAKY